ncbi:hypothetical protein [Runella salmonicolor]|uniref:HTTM domain-containing protein n=1 Tax=Runella salmonicolor TaxID=2950278 RepID=A0ABT1G1A8_9BACT|nr:hypothetical protein [Runella salmonicolor]MCP1386507.1 hypothetical protein [Runella salmonicolor]
MKKRLLNFWFDTAPAERLAAFRIGLGLFSLGYILPRIGMYRQIARQGADLFEPVGVFGGFSTPMNAGMFDALLFLTLAANIAFLLGWHFRQTGPAFGVFLLALLCYRNSWSMIFHNDNVLVWHALVVGFTPAADAYSLDAHRRGRVGSLLLGSSARWQYGWTLKLLMAIATTPYLLSGIAKLAGPAGLDWMTGEIMRDQVATDTLRKIVLGTSSSDMIFGLYNLPWLFSGFALMTMIVELGAPFALIKPKIAMTWAVMAILMHIGILLVMNITFRYQLTGAMFACFFPLEYPIGFLSNLFKRRGKQLVS